MLVIKLKWFLWTFRKVGFEWRKFPFQGVYAWIDGRKSILFLLRFWIDRSLWIFLLIFGLRFLSNEARRSIAAYSVGWLSTWCSFTYLPADKVYILCRCLNPQPTLCNLPATCRTSLHNQATPLKGVKLWTFQSFHPFMFFFKYHFMLHVMHTLLWLSYKRLSLLGIILKWILQIFLTKILNIAVNACTVRTVLHDVTENIAGNKCYMLFT